MCLPETCSRPEDKTKIRLAVGLRRVDPVDVPASAKASNGPASVPHPKKRKSMNELSAGSSQIAGPSSQSLTYSTSGQVNEIEDEDESVDIDLNWEEKILRHIVGESRRSNDQIQHRNDQRKRKENTPTK